MLSVIASLLIVPIPSFANEFIVTSNDNELIFTKGILYEHNMIYLPTKELLDLLKISQSEENFFRKDGNKFSLYIANDQYPNIYNMEIGKKEIVYTQEPETFSPAIRETKYAPILSNDLIYIPFEFIEYIVPLEKYGLEWVNTNIKNSSLVWIMGGILLLVFSIIYTLKKQGKKNI